MDEPPPPEVKDEPLWEIIKPGRLALRGSRLSIILCLGEYPYHVHRFGADGRDQACFGCADDLGSAKVLALEAYRELIEMGIEP